MLKKTELRLRKGADRRLRGGHCWIYSNEVDTSLTPLADFSAGDPVRLVAASGAELGVALMEPRSLICARLLSRDGQAMPDTAFYRERVKAALRARQPFFDKPFYRLVYGDSDGLSGVVIDRYGDYLVLQLNTAGSERHLEPLLDALAAELSPTGVLLRCDSRARREQGLEERCQVVLGDVPELLPLEENGVRFEAPVHGGQKTGWFYDHRVNRATLQALCTGRRVLDVYSYIGGWGVQAAAAGASAVDAIDVSQPALDGLRHNAALNGVEDRVTLHCGRADARLQAMASAGERYDVVVLDPPAFVQRKRDLGKGRKAYRRLFELGLAVVADEGLLIAASCSMHFSEHDLLEALAGAARRGGRSLAVVGLGGQGPDHPLHPAIPETRYLKAAFARVTAAG